MIDATGTPWCWGNDHDGQFGDGETAITHFSPERTLFTNVTAIAAGAQHTCVHRSDSSVQCAGNDERGQLGDGLRTSQSAPHVVPGIGSNVSGLSAGGEHTCAWFGDGTVQCWGKNSDGELGDGTAIDRDAPTDVGITGVTAVSAGYDHTCALLGSSTAECWGDNSFGQLGDGTTSSSTVPVLVQDYNPSAKSVVNLSAGGNHTCVALSAGTQCWGTNADGELGINNGSTSTNAAENSSGTFTAVSAVPTTRAGSSTEPSFVGATAGRTKTAI